jgi:serine/threonine protein kinase
MLNLGSHEHVVGIQAVYEDTESFYVITEKCQGGELFDFLMSACAVPERECKRIMLRILLAVQHLHVRGVFHRDIKPENILLDAEGHIRVTDFGLAKGNVTGPGAEGGTKTFCGTPEYLAPEMLENKGHGRAVDWWALGTLTYEMLVGLPPFFDSNVQRMYQKKVVNRLTFHMLMYLMPTNLQLYHVLYSLTFQVLNIQVYHRMFSYHLQLQVQ